MVLPLLVVAALSITADGQPAGQPGEKCCDSKMVGGIEYTLTGQMDTQAYQCLNDCVYQKTGETGMRYCFAMGDEKVECQDEEGRPTPPAGGGEGATQEPGGATQGQGGATQGQGCRCGVKKAGNRIVGGQDADINEYPWMVALYFINESFVPVSGCGGSIINSKWIITALHCVVKSTNVTNVAELEVFPPSTGFVLIGEHQLSLTTETDITRNYRVKEIVISQSGYDLALVKVDGDIDTSIHTPVCLPVPGDDFTNRSTVVTGWGVKIPSKPGESNVADVLQEITLPIHSAAKCNQILSAEYNLTQIVPFPNILCFGGEMNKSVCFGDSGGPLIMQKQGQERWTLAGIVSAILIEMRCAEKGGYGIAVEVASFVDFIKSTTADGEFCDE